MIVYVESQKPSKNKMLELKNFKHTFFQVKFRFKKKIVKIVQEHLGGSVS